jgi:hypothetical protein
MAGDLVPRLKKRETLELPGGRWEIGYDFAKSPRLIWTYNGRSHEPFAVIPSQKRIVGLGALRYGYAERKLVEARQRLASS